MKIATAVREMAGKHRIYSITMKTPVGVRHGKINIFIKDDRINGTLDMLARSEPLSGTVEKDGSCRINGYLTTLIRNVRYTAVGKITEDSIELSMKGERNIFKITGIADKEEVKE